MLTPDKITTINGVKVCEYLLANHNVNKIILPPMRTKPFIGVTIHNTNDLKNVEDDAEQYTRATVNGNMGTVRTQLYTNAIGAWQDLVGVIRDKSIYTIVAQQHGSGVLWGKLKSGAGWISLGSKYVKKV